MRPKLVRTIPDGDYTGGPLTAGMGLGAAIAATVTVGVAAAIIMAILYMIVGVINVTRWTARKLFRR